MNNTIFRTIALAATLLLALLAGQGAWAQATQEVGVMFGYQQNQTQYKYAITPLNLGGQAVSTEYQSNNYVRFNDQEYDIGDDNIPLKMKLYGKVNFNNTGNFTVDNGGSKFEITFTSATKYIMGVSVYNSSDEAVSDCTITGSGTKSVTVKIPDQTIFSKVILTIANHTPFDKDNSATISGIDAEYLDDGVNEPVPTVTYRESNGSAPVTLTAGTDYTVSYKNNHYLGTATLTVTGTGNYIGSVSKDYNIRSYDLRDFNKLGDNIYEIATKDDLDHLAIYVNRENDCNGITFKQTADIAYNYQYAWDNIIIEEITLGDGTVKRVGHLYTENNYTAIGGYGKPFKGTYDGQGHSISGIRIKKDCNDNDNDKNNASSQGFIGFLGSGGTVKNVLVKDALIDAWTNIGGIVGYNSGTITDCTAYHVRVYCEKLSGQGHGPIIGYNEGTVTRSHNRECLTVRAIYSEFDNYSYTDNLFALTLGTSVTASKTSGESVTIDGVTYYTAGSTFTIGYSGEVPAGSTVIYTVTKTSGGRVVTSDVLTGTTLTMPAYDVTASAVAADNTMILTGTLIDGFYWTTFYHSAARYTLPEGATAYTMDGNYLLYRLGTDGRTIRENTAVVILSETQTIALTLTGDTSKVSIHGGGNILSGSDSPVKVSGLSGTPYVLGIVNGKLGFYEYKGGAVPANKAYFVQ